MNKFDKIWHGYRTAKEGQTVAIRSGFGAYGIYPLDINNPFDFARSESDAEHVYGAMILAFQIHNFFPEVINDKLYIEILEGLMIHELGENISGDIMDDGTRDEVKKDQEEILYLTEYLEPCPNPRRKELMDIFLNFQHKSSEPGILTRLCDKTEAILQNFIYEAQGRGGDFNIKRKNIKNISECDKTAFDATCSARPADIWAYGFYNDYKDYPNFNIFLGIIHAGARDVRGVEFQWL